LLDVTARLVHAMLPELDATADYAALQQRCMSPGVTLLQPAGFLIYAEPTAAGTRLPAAWAVTSDSIAARLAVMLGADELVLLKSAPFEFLGKPNVPQMAAAGFVDANLPQLAGETPPLRIATLGD
jgi:aspartokinase-like uncharacterized kinase